MWLILAHHLNNDITVYISKTFGVGRFPFNRPYEAEIRPWQ